MLGGLSWIPEICVLTKLNGSVTQQPPFEKDHPSFCWHSIPLSKENGRRVLVIQSIMVTNDILFGNAKWSFEFDGKGFA